MADDREGEKTEEPSQYRIDEFRRRGEVSSSKELTSLLLLTACVLTLGLSVVYMYEVLAQFIEWLYSLDMHKAYSEKSLKIITRRSFLTALKCVAPIFIISFVASIFANIVQFGFLFATEVLQLKFDRINPVNGFKRLFSLRSIVEAIKGIFKFILVAASVYLFIKDDVFTYSGFLHMDMFNSFLYARTQLVKLGMVMILGLILVAIGDFIYQKISYNNKLKQTKDEAKRETKEQDGNPEVRQRIRAIQRDLSQKRMMADIPTADVIVTNPTHLSIMLKYDKETMVSPKVIGKGADHLALRIREIAKQHNIPLVENVPLARSLYKTVKIGESVPRNLYKAVAEVLAFVYKIKNREKALNA